MNITGNTIVMTGGGSGIGKGLAEALHKKGNQLIISGRRKDALDKVTAANPGMKSLALDITQPASIKEFAGKIARDFPQANVLINNSGIMQVEDLNTLADSAIAEATVITNLLGPIRLTTAMLPHLKKQPSANILFVSSGLAFVPIGMTPTYCASKAAIHSYAQSLRFQLSKSKVQVQELAPPYVQTELMGEHQKNDPRAMPLGLFIAQVMKILESDPNATEILVESVKRLRFAEKNGKYDDVFNMLNAMMPAPE